MKIMKASHVFVTLVLFTAVLLAGCSSQARVGALRSESQSVDLGDAKSVSVEIDMGAGDLRVSGGAAKLLEAGFDYNVAALKPDVRYTAGKLVVRQPEVNGLPYWRDITDYRNEWNLRLYDEVPMDLRVALGAGAGNLQLGGLTLTGLDISLGAGEYTIDLTGEWARDLGVTIDAGAANLRLRLPKDVGVRVQVQDGPHTVDATGLTEDGGVYTNAAYGVSAVTLQLNVQAGIGQINLEVEDTAAMSD